MSQITIETTSRSIYENLITSMIQDVVARTTTQAQTLRSRYGDNPEPYYYDKSGNLDIHGMPKQQDSTIYFHCDNCNRDVSANRFAAHIERCLSRGRRG
ncbi:LANO_0E09956g1_1 [Lachancea nothofagi CBS 11611]|uniref:SAGA-associated factor 11 n=1 Tax=Lachancea nothofagi CBS 11611 TaxID=1266666 RepID=A0A1G4JW79_9SACH|nr:LANO_0E09956g1_1 [Lachancea nothofagi CBS 11611]